MSKAENRKTITLSQGITRGDKSITDITVLKPTIASLKGLSLIHVLNMEVDSISILLPKITQPTLHKNDIQQLDVADFIELAGTVAGFLAKTTAVLEA